MNNVLVQSLTQEMYLTETKSHLTGLRKCGEKEPGLS